MTATTGAEPRDPRGNCECKLPESCIRCNSPQFPHNVLLITQQCPHASAVAGFHTWKSVGRAVRQGEKGIAILAPIQRRATSGSADTGTDTAPDTASDSAPGSAPGQRPAAASAADADGPSGGSAAPRRLTGFRIVHVFDISQTDGPDLPEAPHPVLLDGQAPLGLLDGLTEQVHEQGFQLLRHDVDIPHPGQGTPNGVTDYFARTVIVRPDLTGAQTVKTFAHELGHVLLHGPTQRPPELTRPQAEVEAESVAYIVTAAHSVDSSGYTVPYVAGWAAGNTELVARSAERVLATAKHILTRTPPPPALELDPATRERLRSPARAQPAPPEIDRSGQARPPERMWRGAADRSATPPPPPIPLSADQGRLR